MLSDSLWRLASTLDERQTVSAAVSHLIVLQVGLPERSVGRDWIRDRTAVLGRRLDELDTDVSERVDRLVRLAEACQRLCEHATALDAAKRSAENADPDLTAAMAGALAEAGAMPPPRCPNRHPRSCWPTRSWPPSGSTATPTGTAQTQFHAFDVSAPQTRRGPDPAPMDHNSCSSRARSTASRRRPVPSFR